MLAFRECKRELRTNHTVWADPILIIFTLRYTVKKIVAMECNQSVKCARILGGLVRTIDQREREDLHKA